MYTTDYALLRWLEMEISRYQGFIRFTYYCIRRQRTKKHIYIGTYIIYWNLIVTSLPGLRLTLSSLNFELANLIPPRPTNQAHSVTKSDSIEQLIKVQIIKRGKHISNIPSRPTNQPHSSVDSLNSIQLS